MISNSSSTNTNNIFSKEKKLFFFVLALSFIAVFIFTYLTPLFNDDYFYLRELKEADNFFDLFKQEWEEYLSYNGRYFGLLFTRIALYFPAIFFKIANSMFFVGLSLLIYANINSRKKYDARLLLLINLCMWFFCIEPGETLFWITGTCNYLWTGTIILGFVTAYRYLLKKNKTSIFLAIGMFLFGVIAGWCNENTSGGAILATIALLINYRVIEAKHNKTTCLKTSPWMISGIIGQITGLTIMVFAPGYDTRLALSEETHTGIIAILSRFQKITLVMKNHFFLLIAIFTVLLILCLLQKKSFYELRNALLFFGLFLATSYALILVPETQIRAHFGACIFLLISIIQLFSLVSEDTPNGLLIKWVKMSTITVMSILFVLTYFEVGASLDRIYRQSNEQIEAIEEAIANSNTECVYVNDIDPIFDNHYTYAFTAKLSDDPDYWVNKLFCEYYGIDQLIAIPRR